MNLSEKSVRVSLVRTIVIFCSILFSGSKSEKSWDLSPPLILKAVKEPEIFLRSYLVEDTFRFVSADKFRSPKKYQDDFVSKIDSDFIFSEETNYIDFTCIAKYPISWTFPFPEQIKPIVSYDIRSSEARISLFGHNNAKPANIQYKIVIRFGLSRVEFLSLNLTCTSVEKIRTLRSSVHIYQKGKQAIEHEGETIQVYVAPHNAPILLPCRPSSPNVKIILHKHIRLASFSLEKQWITQEIANEHLTFDPKKGFTLYRGMFGRRIFGVYKCTVMISNGDNVHDDNEGTTQEFIESDQFVFINVTEQVDSESSKPETSAFIFEPKSIIHGKATVQLDFASLKGLQLSNTMITCCSGSISKPPKLYMEYCGDPLQCKLVKDSFLKEIDAGRAQDYLRFSSKLGNLGIVGLDHANVSSGCRQEMFLKNSVVVACKGEKLDFVDHLLSFVDPVMVNSIANRSKTIYRAGYDGILYEGNMLTNYKKTVSLTQFQSSTVSETGSVSQRMLLLIGYLPTKRKLLRRVLDPFVFVRIGSGLRNGDTLKDFKKPKFYVMEYDRDVFYEGESMIFMCFGIKLAYATGSHLRIKMKNGTTVTVEPIRKDKLANIIGMVYLRGQATMFSSIVDGVSMLGKKIKASNGMSSVDCWMPKRNSSKWDKISKKMQVLPSVAPGFLEKKEETVYFYLGDVGNVIRCTVNQGMPLPFVKIKRNGKRLKLNINPPKNKMKQRVPQNGTNQEEKIDVVKKLITITVNFPVIDHQHHGVVQCIAKNVNGTAIRTVKILVIEKRGVVLPITISCVGVLILVLVGLGVKRWRDKETLMSLHV